MHSRLALILSKTQSVQKENTRVKHKAFQQPFPMSLPFKSKSGQISKADKNPLSEMDIDETNTSLTAKNCQKCKNLPEADQCVMIMLVKERKDYIKLKGHVLTCAPLNDRLPSFVCIVSHLLQLCMLKFY